MKKTTPGATTNDVKDGAVTAVKQSIGGATWNFNGAITSTDSDTIAWGAGTLAHVSGTTYSIAAGNTGNMAAVTWIYLDTDHHHIRLDAGGPVLDRTL